MNDFAARYPKFCTSDARVRGSLRVSLAFSSGTVEGMDAMKNEMVNCVNAAG